MRPFINQEVDARYQSWPPPMRQRLLGLRELIFEVADQTNRVGSIQETLKWNTPAYLTLKPKSGTTIRLDGNADRGQYGLYVHCQTSLVENFRETYPNAFTYDKNRGIIFSIDSEPKREELRHCISLALTYHLDK